MKILLVSNLYPPHVIGGYERLCASIADELVRRGHELRVVTSSHGGPVSSVDPIPVDRGLRLLADEANIYAPFVVSDAERSAINAMNVSVLRRSVDVFEPDVAIVGNLHFFDKSILAGLHEIAERSVYLLTDVWRIVFEEPELVQRHFREHAWTQRSDVAPLVPRDASALFVDWLEPEDDERSYVAAMIVESGRRRRIERELLGGASVGQFRGECFCCGPTVFRLEIERDATPMVEARRGPRCACARCELGIEARVGLHFLDTVDDRFDDDSLIVASSDPDDIAAFRSVCPGVVTIEESGPSDLRSPRSCALVIDSGGSDESFATILLRLSKSLTKGARIVVTTVGRRSATSQDVRVATALSVGCVPNRRGTVWSDEFGYLGGEVLLLEFFTA